MEKLTLLKDAAQSVAEVFDKTEGIFTYVVKFCVLLIELVGVCIVIFAVARAVIGIFKKDEFVRLNLAEGIALALEFKMGGELLRTVIAREWSELLILGAVILLRAAMAFLIQWEIRIEKKNGLTIHGMNRELEEGEKALNRGKKDRKKDGGEEKKGYGEDE